MEPEIYVDDRRYTLDEARAELARRQCEIEGHDLEIVLTAYEPTGAVCSRCAASWKIA